MKIQKSGVRSQNGGGYPDFKSLERALGGGFKRCKTRARRPDRWSATLERWERTPAAAQWRQECAEIRF